MRELLVETIHKRLGGNPVLNGDESSVTADLTGVNIHFAARKNG